MSAADMNGFTTSAVEFFHPVRLASTTPERFIAEDEFVTHRGELGLNVIRIHKF